MKCISEEYGSRRDVCGDLGSAKHTWLSSWHSDDEKCLLVVFKTLEENAQLFCVCVVFESRVRADITAAGIDLYILPDRKYIVFLHFNSRVNQPRAFTLVLPSFHPFVPSLVHPLVFRGLSCVHSNDTQQTSSRARPLRAPKASGNSSLRAIRLTEKYEEQSVCIVDQTPCQKHTSKHPRRALATMALRVRCDSRLQCRATTSSSRCYRESRSAHRRFRKDSYGGASVSGG